MIDLESYLIPAMESDTTISSISSIIKKYPIKYPKELNKYQFDDKGNFDNSVKTALEEFFYSKWEKRFNDILSEALSLPAYKEKIKSYCEKTGYSIKDFELELYDIYFRYYKDEPKSTQMYLNISFRNMDRYDAPGFPQLMGPILSQIVKYDIGNKWVVSMEEYPTDFSIYRPLNSSEMKVLQQLQDTIDEKKRIAKEKASASKKLRDQKNKERVDQEISKDSKRFYDQALKAQAMEIVKHFTFKQKWYYVNTNDIDLQQAKESCEDLKAHCC